MTQTFKKGDLVTLKANQDNRDYAAVSHNRVKMNKVYTVEFGSREPHQLISLVGDVGAFAYRFELVPPEAIDRRLVPPSVGFPGFGEPVRNKFPYYPTITVNTDEDQPPAIPTRKVPLSLIIPTTVVTEAIQSTLAEAYGIHGVVSGITARPHGYEVSFA